MGRWGDGRKASAGPSGWRRGFAGLKADKDAANPGGGLPTGVWDRIFLNHRTLNTGPNWPPEILAETLNPVMRSRIAGLTGL